MFGRQLDVVFIKNNGEALVVVDHNKHPNTFIFTANFTGINPTIEGGIVATDMSLTNPKWQ